jgi:pyruvate/2-oxoglutarate dehydrogenase complex dihydrolipoamide dehydrogenase (E3) component
VLLDVAEGILPNEDRDAAEIVAQSLLRDGIQIQLPITDLSFTLSGQEKLIRFSRGGQSIATMSDAVLLAVGRVANTDGLALEVAGVRFDSTGVLVDARLRTSNRDVFAVGDVCSKFKFTHAADAMARIAIQNALFLGRAKFDPRKLPHCTYTEPELARIGLSYRDAAEQGIATDAFEHPFDKVDRSVLDGETEGFVRVLTRRGSDQIVGATIVGSRAGDMIAEMAVAIVNRIGLKKISKTVYPYPTQSECIKKVADAYNRSRLSPNIQTWLRRWLAWNRS